MTILKGFAAAPCRHWKLTRIVLPLFANTSEKGCFRCEDCQVKLSATLRPLDMKVKVLESRNK